MISPSEALSMTLEAQAQYKIEEQQRIQKEYEAIDAKILNIAKTGGTCIAVEPYLLSYLEPYRETGYLIEEDTNYGKIYINWSGKLLFPPIRPVVKTSFFTKVWNYCFGFFK